MKKVKELVRLPESGDLPVRAIFADSAGRRIKSPRLNSVSFF